MHMLHDGEPHSLLSFALGVLAGLVIFGLIALNKRRTR